MRNFVNETGIASADLPKTELNLKKNKKQEGCGIRPQRPRNPQMPSVEEIHAPSMLQIFQHMVLIKLQNYIFGKHFQLEF